MSRLSESDVHSALKRAANWSESGDSIQRTIRFPDFKASIAFVNAIAEEAERMNHHPDILIRYNKVTLTLSTHDAGGLTQKDFDLAATIDSMAPAETPA